MSEESLNNEAPEVVEDSSLGMSDEEFLNSEFSAPDFSSQVDEEPAPVPESTDKPNTEEEPDGSDDAPNGEAGEESEEADGEDPDSETPDTEESPEADEQEPDEDKPEEKDEPEDFKALYNEVMAPFKANGRMMQAKTPEEVRQLMMMGANYSKKMTGMKPHLKTLKLLEQNELLDEDKLSYLIDLNQGKPEAIAKLLKDSNIDPIDLDLDSGQSYQPTDRKVTDEELAFDEVVSRNTEDPTFPKVLDTVGNKWDTSSRQVVAQHPQLLEVINDHMASGVYDVISTEVERQRMLGQLSGMSDLEAYRQVGDTLHANGGFDHLNSNKDVQGQQSKPEVRKPPKQQSKPSDKEREDRRRAASGTRVAPTSNANKQDFNPLALPDEEFEKLVL